MAFTFQTISFCIAWTSFILLTNMNVLPVVIESASEFYVQGFLLGVSITNTIVLKLLFRERKRSTRIRYASYSTHPFFLILSSSLTLGGSFGTQYVFYEHPNTNSQLIMTSKGSFVTSLLFFIVSHIFIVIFFIVKQFDCKQTYTPYIIFWILKLNLVSLVSLIVGFSTLVTYDQLLGVSSSFALACGCSSCVFCLILYFTIKTEKIDPNKAFRKRLETKLKSDSELTNLKAQLQREKYALEVLKLKQTQLILV